MTTAMLIGGFAALFVSTCFLAFITGRLIQRVEALERGHATISPDGVVRHPMPAEEDARFTRSLRGQTGIPYPLGHNE